MKKLNHFLDENHDLLTISNIIPFAILENNENFNDAVECGYFDITKIKELKYDDEINIEAPNEVTHFLQNKNEYTGVACINFYCKNKSELSSDGKSLKNIITNKSCSQEVWVVYKDIDNLIEIIKDRHKEHIKNTIIQIKTEILKHFFNITFFELRIKRYIFNDGTSALITKENTNKVYADIFS